MLRQLKVQSPRFLKGLNPLILLLLGTALLRLSWQKWVNIALNYGRELYTPWRISCGGVLYKDIASLYGPLPPYWHALIFKIFGVSIMTVCVWNILLVGCMTAFIYVFFRHAIDRRTALFTSMAFLSINAFNQGYGEEGLYTFICPYSYSVTYGIFFSLAAMLLLALYRRPAGNYLWTALGVLTGLTVLCRFEIFVCLIMAFFFVFIFKRMLQGWPLIQNIKAGGFLLGGFLIPVGITYIYFSTQLPHAQVLSSIFGVNGKWQEVLKLNYYQSMIGLDHPCQNFLLMLKSALGYGLVVLAFQLLSMDLVWGVLGLPVLAAGIVLILSFHYEGIFRGLPLLVIGMIGYLVSLLLQFHQDENKTERLWLILTFAVWSLLMLSKVFLKVQIDNEGFIYAMPAVMLFFVFFLGIIPKYFEHKIARAYFLQTLSSVLLLLLMGFSLKSLADVYAARHFLIQAGPDAVISNLSAHPENGQIAEFLDNADKIMDKKANFVAFTDGAMLNFLTKRVDPLPFTVFKPTEIISYGQKKILRLFKEKQPDYIVLSNRGWQSTVYPGPHGDNTYPYAIKDWVLTHYHQVWPEGLTHDDQIVVLKRSS